MLRGVTKERSKILILDFRQVSLSVFRKLLGGILWENTVLQNAKCKKEEMEAGQTTKEEFRNTTSVCRDCVRKAKIH